MTAQVNDHRGDASGLAGFSITTVVREARWKS
jgi:hypothetical protein